MKVILRCVSDWDDVQVVEIKTMEQLLEYNEGADGLIIDLLTPEQGFLFHSNEAIKSAVARGELTCLVSRFNSYVE